jgi:hypothetical protein
MTEQERLGAANKFIQAIAGCGRNFFRHEDFVSSFELSPTGRVFFIDYYTKKRIYTHRSFVKWRGFTSGGTLKALVENLRDFIKKGCLLNANYFENDITNGYKNPWGYGDDIAIVKDSAIKLGIAA